MTCFLQPRRHADPKVRVFGFHHAGGSASSYVRMIRGFPESWDALLSDLPGRGKRHREPLPRSIDEIVTGAVKAMEPWLDRPFALLGHSLGAVVAYEVAGRLESGGRAPAWVGVSGRGPNSPADRGDLCLLGDAQLVDWMIEIGGAPDALRTAPEIAVRAARVLRADLRCMETYAETGRRPVLTCPITAFGGRQDPMTAPAELAGWADRTSSFCTVELFHGGHFYLLGEEMPRFVEAIVANVSAELASVPRRYGMAGRPAGFSTARPSPGSSPSWRPSPVTQGA